MSIPSFITMLNLLSGCIAILLSFHDLALAGLMILLAGVLDFVDGLAARFLMHIPILAKNWIPLPTW
jgi:CDP-diacylglycerol---serine O-phosphatidyltransferase